MKPLLTAIRSKLRADLSYVRDRDIFITEDEALLPRQVKFPAVALKDGDVANRLDDKDTIEQQMEVRVTAYAQILKPEESIMGSAGVLQMAADITASLQENTLGLTGVYDAFAVSEEASETFGDEQEMIQKKTVVLRYWRRAART